MLVNPDLGAGSQLQMDEVRRPAHGGERRPLRRHRPRPPDDRARSRTSTAGGPAFASDGEWGTTSAVPSSAAGACPDVDAPHEVVRVVGRGPGDGSRGGRSSSPPGCSTSTTSARSRPPGASRPGWTSTTIRRPGVLVDLDVVGIGDPFDEIVVDEGFADGSIMLTPAFVETYDPAVLYWGGLVRLRPGADEDQFRAAVEGLVPDEPIAFQSRRGIEDQADRAVAPQVAALGIFSVIAAVVALVIVGQAISRRLQVDAVALAPMAALGVTRPQRAALGHHPRSPSPRWSAPPSPWSSRSSPHRWRPVGVARDAEPDPGSAGGPAGAGPGWSGRGPRLRHRGRPSCDRGRPTAGRCEPAPRRRGPGPPPPASRRRRWRASGSPSTEAGPASRPERRWPERPPASPSSPPPWRSRPA